MGKRDKSEVEDIVHDDSSKKAKKHKKDKKDNDRVEEIPSESTEAVVTTVDQDKTQETEHPSITIDDYEKMKPVFKSWLKDVKDMYVQQSLNFIIFFFISNTINLTFYYDSELDNLNSEETSERFAKFVKKFNKQKLPEKYSKIPKYYPPAPTTGDVSILLFYAYTPYGLMTRGKFYCFCFLFYYYAVIILLLYINFIYVCSFSIFIMYSLYAHFCNHLYILYSLLQLPRTLPSLSATKH